MTPIKICLITAARSDYDRLHSLIREMLCRKGLELDIVPIHMHLSPHHGLTVRDIEGDGFVVADQVEMLISSATDVGVTKSVGVGTIGLADVLRRLSPDVVMVLGDRSELLAVAAACVCQRIVLAHVCGGEITEGAIDDQVRHMLTKASHLHFTANEVFGDRVRQMGEEDWRVCVSGSPALDGIDEWASLSREELELDLGIDLSRRTGLVTFHPVTLSDVPIATQMTDLLDALADHDLQYVITHPNADVGSDVIVAALERFCASHSESAKLFGNLGRRRYLSMMRHASVVIGNSSSGIVESSSFNVPVVNVGTRQVGRVFGENVFQAEPSRDSISSAIRSALAYNRPSCTNPYGDGAAAARIATFMESIFRERGRNRLLLKKFVDRL
jgi:UDP-hydrolysing UDP-N-acetyl-D-glucosamine 2-epimerase